MKIRWFLIVVLLLASVAAFRKQRQVLAALEKERIVLSPAPAGHPAAVSGRFRASVRDGKPPRSQGAGGGSHEHHLDAIEEILLGFHRQLADNPGNSGRMRLGDKQRELVEHLSALDRDSFARLLERIAGLPEIPPDRLAEYLKMCVDPFGDAHPEEALHALLPLENFPDRQDRIDSLYRKWSARNPGAALRWFEEESAAGGEIAGSLEVLQAAVLAQTRIDPAKAIAWIASKPEDFEQAASGIGSSMVRNLRQPQEHHAFLHALQRHIERFPELNALRRIRASYLSELHEDLAHWPFEQAISLLSALDRAEQEEIVLSMPSYVLSDRSMWADWLLPRDLRNGDKPLLASHIESWTLRDPVAAGQWLDALPESPLRTELVERHEHIRDLNR